jgi:hypothetical protein
MPFYIEHLRSMVSVEGFWNQAHMDTKGWVCFKNPEWSEKKQANRTSWGQILQAVRAASSQSLTKEVVWCVWTTMQRQEHPGRREFGGVGDKEVAETSKRQSVGAMKGLWGLFKVWWRIRGELWAQEQYDLMCHKGIRQKTGEGCPQGDSLKATWAVHVRYESGQT